MKVSIAYFIRLLTTKKELLKDNQANQVTIEVLYYKSENEKSDNQNPLS